MLNSRIDSNVMAMFRIVVSINPASVAANTTAEQTFTVAGLRVNDEVAVSKPTNGTAGFHVAGARVSAKDTLALTFGNHTGGALDPGAENYTIMVFRPDPDRLNQDITGSP